MNFRLQRMVIPVITVIPVLPIVLTLLLVWMGPTSARGQEEEGFLPENPLEGRALFVEKLCVKCHSIQGIGGRTGPDLGEIWLGGFADIASNLWNHFPRMRESFQEKRLEWPKVSEEESRKLISFLYFLNYFDKVSSPEIGERLFHEKNCIRCHSVGGKGGNIGPKLDPFQASFGAPYITAALWNSGPEMLRTMTKEKVPRPAFRERDVMDILAFIRSKGLHDRVERKRLPVPNPVSGRDLFEEKRCSQCHSIRGEGGKIAPDLATRGLKGSLSRILGHMWNHGSKMWPRMKKEGIEFPVFTPEEMSDLTAYLYFLEFNDFPGSRTAGKSVFTGKKCSRCHIPKIPGEKTIGPNLADAGLTDPFNILAEMWNHAPAIEKRMIKEDIRWPLLKSEEIRDLIEYIISLDEEP